MSNHFKKGVTCLKKVREDGSIVSRTLRDG